MTPVLLVAVHLLSLCHAYDYYRSTNYTTADTGGDGANPDWLNGTQATIIGAMVKIENERWVMQQAAPTTKEWALTV